MRIVIDMQGAQSTESRNRGIGRYSLSMAKGIARNRGEHEVIIALSALFPDRIGAIREAFNELVPEKNIRIWDAPGSVAYLNGRNTWRRESSELIRESFLLNLEPDIIFVTSLFEGLVDDAITSIGKISTTVPIAATLYDLIPCLNPEIYLNNVEVKRWYEEKLSHLRNASAILAISESSRQEAIQHIGFLPEKSVNIGTDADPQFRKLLIDEFRTKELMQAYNLYNPFLMYTGGIDHRKNIERLIIAYSQISKAVRDKHQLAIICSAKDEEKDYLKKLARHKGLADGELVLTGFVPEEDLVALYNLCKAFVFPSWHEGFGLPVLEAMRCGAPVIGSNTSSIPEVIGHEGALFDPFDEQSMTDKIVQVLINDAFRNELIRHSKKQASKFSWDISAKQAIQAFEKLHRSHAQANFTFLPKQRPRLAYISPLPPERSGIADYSAELIPELAKHYEVEVIVDQKTVDDHWIVDNCRIRNIQWFRKHHEAYDRVLYHFGNSPYHQHMFETLNSVPGVVVLHDFYLGDVIAHMDLHLLKKGLWAKELYFSFGYKAVQELFNAKDTCSINWKYPCNKSVVENAYGVIVHSENSKRLAKQWLGEDVSRKWAVIPLLRFAGKSVNKGQTKKMLGFDEGSFLVCSFGLLGPTKLNKELLEAWMLSELSKDSRCKLVFVGENNNGLYGQELLRSIKATVLKDRIYITGWADKDLFRQYLAAADLGIQLRAFSRGETSAAVLDCMNYRIPTIVNANGSMADIPDDGVRKLPDKFTIHDLTDALNTLWKNEKERIVLGRRARQIIDKYHDPSGCAKEYAESIEKFYKEIQYKTNALITAIAQLDSRPGSDKELIQVAQAVANNQSGAGYSRLFIDVSALMQRDSTSRIQRIVRILLKELIANPPVGYRVEPVYAVKYKVGYRYARTFTLDFLGCPSQTLLTDDPIDINSGDVFLSPDLQSQVVQFQQDYLKSLQLRGVKIYDDIVACLNCIDPSFSVCQNIAAGIGLPEKLIWRVEGPFDSSYSLALLNRETARAIRNLGHVVALHSTEGPGDFAPDKDFLTQNPDLARMHDKSIEITHEQADVVSRILYPPRVSDMRGSLNLLHHYAWEETGFPQEWVDAFNRHLDGITCLSNHVEKVLIDNGVTVPLSVSGCGVDHWQLIAPDHSFRFKARSFRFLHVSSCFPRKGVDVLLHAYGNAFTNNDDVTLIIKTFSNPHNEIQRWLAEAKDNKNNFPDVLVMEEELTDAQLKALYKQCQVLVAPSRAEGFGLPIAEALLSGLVVITTAWGGQLDFCNEETAWLIDYSFEAAQTHFNLFDSVWASPNVETLSKTMRSVYEMDAGSRAKQAQKGKERLLEDFKWTDVASRLVASARTFAKAQKCLSPKIGWVSTWNTRCGIAAYSEHLIKNMPVEITILSEYSQDQIRKDTSNVIRCWGTNQSENLNALSRVINEQNIDTLVIQFNYGFFNFDCFGPFLQNQIDAGRCIIIAFHSTFDPVHVDPEKRLERLAGLLKCCHRLLVHTIADMNRLKAIGIIDNVTLFPHGIVDYDPANKVRSDKKNRFIIASYGFFLPQKGLLELIQAVGILREKGLDVRLRMVNAEYPIPDSATLIKQAENKIKHLNLDPYVEMVTDFLEDKQSLSLLSDTDLIVFPYKPSTESSSAAVRYGIATGQAVAVTPMEIFDDVAPAVFFLPGHNPDEIARGVEQLMDEFANNTPLTQVKAENAQRWRCAHRYSKLGQRLYNMLFALFNKHKKSTIAIKKYL